jgi:hypothetical protein
MNRRQRFTALITAVATASALVVATAGGAVAAPPVAAPQVAAAAATVPVTGVFTDAQGRTGAFAGTFTPTRFSAAQGRLQATGNLTGTATDAAGQTVGTVAQSVTAPAAIAAVTCQILNLNLGPLHLNVLGLVIDLNQVILNVTAQAAPGNLLGNLLCALTHLLDGPATPAAIAALLNLILAVLAGA